MYNYNYCNNTTHLTHTALHNTLRNYSTGAQSAAVETRIVKPCLTTQQQQQHKSTTTRHDSTDTLQLLESMTLSRESDDTTESFTESSLRVVLSQDKLFQESELREEYGEFRRRVEAELTRKDAQIEELTRKLSAQQTLLNRLALRLGLRDDDDI